MRRTTKPTASEINHALALVPKKQPLSFTDVSLRFRTRIAKAAEETYADLLAAQYTHTEAMRELAHLYPLPVWVEKVEQIRQNG